MSGLVQKNAVRIYDLCDLSDVWVNEMIGYQQKRTEEGAIMLQRKK